MIPLIHLEQDLHDCDQRFVGSYFTVADACLGAQKMSMAPLSWASLEFGSPRFDAFCSQGERPSQILEANFGRGSLVILDYGF